VKPLSGSPLYGRLLASPTNIGLGWEVLPLPYYKNPLIMAVKSFIVQAPGVPTINFFAHKFYKLGHFTTEFIFSQYSKMI
jgi:hypothetical protein